MKRFAIVVVLWLMVSLEYYGPLSPCRPTLTAQIDKTTCHVGEKVTVTYTTEYATSCRANVTHWAMFVGKSDGVVLPTNGAYEFTPTEPGKLVTNLTAYRRVFDLNRSGGGDKDQGPDGKRRAVTLWFEVTVLP